jgi:histidinol phosphatase-like PHP family hydrolase
MTALRPSSIEYSLVDIVNNETLPNTGHGKHEITSNSGFATAEQYKEAVRKSIAHSQKEYSNISEKKEFYELQKKSEKSGKNNKGLLPELLKSIDPEFVKHGGGSLYDYAKLAQLKGQDITTITIHESRMLQLLYKGEDKLGDVARGQFVEDKFDFLLEEAQKIEEELGVKIKFILELENFGEGSIGDKLREERKAFRARFSGSSKVLSTHFIRKNPNYKQPTAEEYEALSEEEKDKIFADNHQFIDGEIDQFEDIIKGHGSTIEEIASGNIEDITKIVNTYIIDVIDQVEREGEEGIILGHCDLIKLNIHKIIEKGKGKEFADEVISKVFSQDEIQKRYGDLFDLVNEKKMFVEINLAGEAKGVGFYGKDLLNKMKEKEVKVVIGSDSHNISDEQGAEKIWEETVKDALLDSGITKVYEPTLKNTEE